MSADPSLELFLQALQQRPQSLLARGSSMWPTLRDGDRVELTPQATPPLLGTIVAVTTPAGGFVVHRLIGRRPDGAVLIKGDHLRAPDGWFPPTHIVAIATRVDRGQGWEPLASTPQRPPSWPRRALDKARRTLASPARAP